MYHPINQIQLADDEDEERDDVVAECSYYNHDFGQAQDFAAKSLNQKCVDFACLNAVSPATNPFKISYERLIQEGFDLASPKMKAKKRKSDAVDGGGRVVRATGRKDRHSKVRTARGPRDRRVRLSPTTAIQFYDVQDRLGYDRPSKAIDWLIKEAKAAIDALEEQQPSAKFSDSNAAGDHGGFSLSQRGMRKKHEHLNDCFVDEADQGSASAALEAYLDEDFTSLRFQQGFCSAVNSNPPQMFEANWEMARLQKMFAWNSVNECSGNARGGGGGGGEEYTSCNLPPPHAAAQPNSSHANLLREPLQSSMINCSWINNDFAGFNFSNELSKIAASATPKQDDQNLKKLVFSMPSTTQD